MRPLYHAWDEPVASLFPLDLSGDIVALRACIDAGTQDGVFCVAAVAFGYDRAVKANREWEKVLKGRTFHMTDLHARKNEFDGIEDDEVHAIMVGTVGAIRKNASFAVAVSCDAALIADSLPSVSSPHPDSENMLAAFKSAYGFMCHLAMSAIGSRANKGKPGRQISYVFEQGDKGQRGLKRYLEYLGEEPHHRLFLNGYSFSRATIADKEAIEGVFHSSDLLAWEWARHVGRHSRNEPIRKSLAELVGSAETVSDERGLGLTKDRTFYCQHISRERLTNLLAFFGDTLAATSVAEAEAAFGRYREVYPGDSADVALARLLQGEG